MAVAFDANGTAPIASGSAVLGTTGKTSTLLTVGSGANRVLVVQLEFSGQAAAISSVAVTWDSGVSNQVCTLIKATDTTGGVGKGQAQLWGLVAPVAGAKTLKVTWNAVNSDVYLHGTSYTGADQTGGTTTFPNSAGTTGTESIGVNFSHIQTSAVNNMTQVSATLDLNSITSTVTQTETCRDNNWSVDGAGSRGTGAATVTHTFLCGDGSGGHWAITGTDIAAVATATAQVPYQPWYQGAPIVAQ